jgi:hypothetical protein
MVVIRIKDNQINRISTSLNTDDIDDTSSLKLIKLIDDDSNEKIGKKIEFLTHKNNNNNNNDNLNDYTNYQYNHPKRKKVIFSFRSKKSS